MSNVGSVSASLLVVSCHVYCINTEETTREEGLWVWCI